ncbi:MAG: WxcM-like domain-containing protein [Alphaproteobacteria bacterium]|nr:MAG: WxcM-like domain-containing protein [Alphaproteobacteria bacterium]
MTLDNVRWIEIPTRVGDGSVSFLQEGEPLAFTPRRMYYLHNIPTGMTRGAHAHRELQQTIWAIHGSFKMVLDDGRNRQEYILDNPTRALYIPKGLWRELYDFSPGAVCAVLASLEYDESDYIRDYNEFTTYVRGGAA